MKAHNNYYNKECNNNYHNNKFIQYQKVIEHLLYHKILKSNHMKKNNKYFKH